ncbi:Protein of unknown function [Pyronema omphalodes CBS 100304]|uniref:Uncharacterized protein n=1 Tax=Pyronema omphalodes (strain CBS 100304) TaxID=1076935 RepID=U4LV75_PYROM|nr:Protein of unknown function [Pyronema omphalodes CBS 100304]
MPTPDYSIFYRCVATRRRVTPNSSHQHSSRRYHIYTTIHYGRVRTASSWVNYVQMNFMGCIRHGDHATYMSELACIYEAFGHARDSGRRANTSESRARRRFFRRIVMRSDRV